MKKFVVASIEELELNKTAFGPESPETPDSEKTAVYGDNGVLIGWKQKFGEAGASAN